MFDLHASVRSFRTQVCLDRSAGKGGCILARVYVGAATANPIWQSPLLVGSETVADSGPIGLSVPSDKPSRLALAIDPVLAGRPAGADPLEIRDHAD